ncbi:MAG: C69 family dipeptidase [Bacillota bacterium]|jgi:dipeptidase|nr:peptidase C69 [Bacillota bacterium]
MNRNTKRSRLAIAIIAAVTALLAIAAPSFACTSIVVGKDASVDGSVMTTHTCDGTYEFRITLVPAQDWEEGAMRPVYKGGGSGAHVQNKQQVGEIPQVAHTYAYWDIAYPFANENQVMMGETTIGGNRELRNGDGMFEIWELQRIGLERATTAREAIKIMGEIAEKYGYGDSGECLTVIDGNEAWFFEIYGAGPFEIGAVWAAQRVPDDEIGVSANRARIGEIRTDDPDNFMYSENIFQVAKDFGWWDESQGPLHFAKVYGWKDSVYNTRREWRVLDLLAPSLGLDPWAVDYPFSVKPDKKVSAADLMAIKRDHYEGTEFDLTKGLAAGPFGNPNRYATPARLGEWERAISMFRCSYVVVMQARGWMPAEIGGVIWFGEDAPHSTCYVPFYCGQDSVPESFARGSRAVLDDCAWWAFNYVSNIADLKYSYMIEDIKALYTKFETEALAMQPAVEQAALDLYKVDPDLAMAFLTNYTNAHAQKVVDAWWKLADDLMVKYQDGYVDLKTVGYPDEWLMDVGFGFITRD